MALTFVLLTRINPKYKKVAFISNFPIPLEGI
jgi:hypothetical protein